MTDPVLAGELVGLEELRPQLLDLRQTGEEPVPADVETPPLALHGPAQAAYLSVGFRDRAGNAPPAEGIGRSQPGRTSAHDDDPRIRIHVGTGHAAAAHDDAPVRGRGRLAYAATPTGTPRRAARWCRRCSSGPARATRGPAHRASSR